MVVPLRGEPMMNRKSLLSSIRWNDSGPRQIAERAQRCSTRAFQARHHRRRLRPPAAERARGRNFLPGNRFRISGTGQKREDLPDGLLRRRAKVFKPDMEIIGAELRGAVFGGAPVDAIPKENRPDRAWREPAFPPTEEHRSVFRELGLIF